MLDTLVSLVICFAPLIHAAGTGDGSGTQTGGGSVSVPADIKSHALYPKPVPPESRAPELMTDLDQFYYTNLDCDYVESADLNAKKIETISALPISNCHDKHGGDDTGLLMCVGTVHCKGVAESINHLDFYLDPVGCTTTDPTECPSAKTCAMVGGAFRIFNSQIENSNSNETINTTKSLQTNPNKEEIKK